MTRCKSKKVSSLARMLGLGFLLTAVWAFPAFADCSPDATAECNSVPVNKTVDVTPTAFTADPVCEEVTNNNCPTDIVVPIETQSQWSSFLTSSLVTAPNSCVSVAPCTCKPTSVHNGTVGAYPGCTITCNSGYTVSGQSCLPNIAVNLRANPTTISGGGSTALVWSVIDLLALNVTCTASSTDNSWNGSVAASGSQNVTPLVASGGVTYTLSCSDSGQNSMSAAVVVTVDTYGACGSDNGQILTSTPINLCSSNNGASVVSPTSTGWTWTCKFSNYNDPVNCSATETTYSWGAWSSCSATSCADGTQTRSCNGSDGSTNNAVSLCDGSASQSCIPQACGPNLCFIHNEQFPVLVNDEPNAGNEYVYHYYPQGYFLTTCANAQALGGTVSGTYSGTYVLPTSVTPRETVLSNTEYGFEGFNGIIILGGTPEIYYALGITPGLSENTALPVYTLPINKDDYTSGDVQAALACTSSSTFNGITYCDTMEIGTIPTLTYYNGTNAATYPNDTGFQFISYSMTNGVKTQNSPYLFDCKETTRVGQSDATMPVTCP